MKNEQLEFSKAELPKVAEQLEGGLFINISCAQFDGTITVSKEYYTVRSGIVLLVVDDMEQVTGDTLLNVIAQCKRIGKYIPGKTYKRVVKHYTLLEFCKLTKI